MSEDFWKLVHGEENEGVSEDTLRIAFSNLIGVECADREGTKKKEEDSKEEEGTHGI